MPEDVNKLLAQDLMTNSYASADANETVSTLLARMKKANTEHALVFDGKKLVGIIAHSALMRNIDLSKAKVANVMRTTPKVAPGQRFNELIRIMRDADAHVLPVVEKEKVVGVVSAQTILQRIKDASAFSALRAEDMATKEPITANENDDLFKLVTRMRQNNVRKLPVLSAKGGVVGVLKLDELATDVMMGMDRQTDDEFKARGNTRSLGKKSALSVNVRSAMDENPVLADRRERGSKIVDLLSKQNNPVVIVTGNGMNGIITTRSALDAFMNTQVAAESETHEIQTSHLPNVDELDRQKIDSMVNKTFSKIKRMMKSEMHMNVAYKQSQKSGLRAKTSVSIRLEGTGQPFFAQAEDWKVLLATKEACTKLENEVTRKYKGRRA